MTVKELALELIEQLPDDATWEDAESAIYVRASIERGLKDADGGRMTPHEEVRKRFGFGAK